MLNDYLLDFANKNKLTEVQVKKYERVFKSVLKSRGMCENCKGLYMCNQKANGYRECLKYDGLVYSEIEECSYKKHQNDVENHEASYVYCDIPKQFLELSLDNIEIPDDNIKEYFAHALNILKNKNSKGLYVYGDLGVGKTYMFMALANSLVNDSKKVAFVKVSNFINDMRKLVLNNDGKYENTIHGLKKVEYLFLDDIGSESVSSFSRDDVLFTILDYRMENNLTTLFTSNYSKKDLLEHYALDKAGNSQSMSAKRLLERIDILSDDFVLVGNNKRR